MEGSSISSSCHGVVSARARVCSVCVPFPSSASAAAAAGGKRGGAARRVRVARRRPASSSSRRRRRRRRCTRNALITTYWRGAR